MRAYLIAFSLFFSSLGFTETNQIRKNSNVTINEVVQYVFKMEQQKIADAINLGLKENKISKGRYFVGEVKDQDKILGKAGLKSLPHVDVIENGFSFNVKGQTVEVEFRDFMSGQVFINGHKVNINKKMSYASLHRAIVKTLKKIEPEKTSFNPMNLIIDEAHALWPLVAVAAGVGLGIAYVVDSSFSYLGYAINSDDKHNQKKFNREMGELRDKCEADYRSLTNGNTSVSSISSVKAVSQLGKNLDKIAEELKDEDTMYLCKDLADAKDVEYESAMFKIDYDSLIAKGCAALDEVHECLLKTKDYMEDQDIEINENRHEFGENDAFAPYVDTMKSTIGK